MPKAERVKNVYTLQSVFDGDVSIKTSAFSITVEYIACLLFIVYSLDAMPAEHYLLYQQVFLRI